MALTAGLRRLARHVAASPLQRESDFYRRHRALSEAIDAQPESITHFVLRGELLADRGDHQRAKADFESALDLARGVDLNRGWGLLEQAMGDRAHLGLRLTERHLRQLADRAAAL